MTKPTDVRVIGPLAAHAAGFCNELEESHYTPISAANQVRLMAHLSRWLARRRLKPGDLSGERIEQFLRHRRRAGYTSWLSIRALDPLLRYLRRLGAVPQGAPRPPANAIERLVADYVEYLRHERAIADTTIRYRQGVACDLLNAISGRDDLPLERLDAQFVRAYALKAVRKYSVGTAGVLTSAIRAFLRFLHARGYILAPIAGAVPTLAGSRETTLPRAVEPACVAQLLSACDRRTAVGRRDYAILMLLARLGLRAGEVASLRLEDLDWRRGELVVHGKGGRHDRLPLPADLGDALVVYLRRGRPECTARGVFVADRAPHRALSSSGVTLRVACASVRAGFARPIYAHRLRHTAATQMLDRGSSLDEIGEVLRHRSPRTTAIYAKVDREALRSVAQPWPRGHR